MYISHTYSNKKWKKCGKKAVYEILHFTATCHVCGDVSMNIYQKNASLFRLMLFISPRQMSVCGRVNDCCMLSLVSCWAKQKQIEQEKKSNTRRKKLCLPAVLALSTPMMRVMLYGGKEKQERYYFFSSPAWHQWNLERMIMKITRECLLLLL